MNVTRLNALFKGSRILSAITVVMASAMAAFSQTSLSRFTPGMTQEGAVYFLPKTAVRVSVLVEKTTYTPGDFASYAQRYLREAAPGREPSVAWRVVGINVGAKPVADSTKAYAVKYNPQTVASRLTLAEDGRLLALNMPDAEDAQSPQPFVAAERRPMVNPRQYMGEDILSCTSTAKMAELTAHEIFDVRENRSMLVKGQADFMPQDGRQMAIMLDELDQENRSLTSLFLGTTERDTTEHVILLAPDAPVQRQVLFRLSQIHGFTDEGDLSGIPFYISVENTTELPAQAAMTRKQKATENGIYVNVPGRMRVTILDGIDTVGTWDMPAAQFGETLLLSGSLFNKRYTTQLLLDPVTGAVRNIVSEAK